MPLSPSELLSFLLLCVVLALLPGPNLAIVLRNTLRGGQSAAVATAAGLTASKVVWAMVSLLGLASVLNASATAWSAVRLAGAAYLIYLGVATLMSQRRESTEGAQRGPAMSLGSAARSGALTDLLNPKVGAFYLAVFPQFIEPGDPLVLSGAILLVAHAVVLMTYYPLAAAISLRASRLVQRGWRAIPETGLGVALIGMGLAIAVKAQR